jgi:hypothetical protein
VVGLSAICAGDALADRHPWRGGDIHGFHHRDLGRWQGGAWRHGHHDGRLGWWWVVGGLWYFYPRPVYPYPDPYVPPVVVAPAPAQNQPATVVEPVQYWYYCEATRSYYPYVATCEGGWKPVPASPPQ